MNITEDLAITETAAAAALCRKSLKAFVREFWSTLEPAPLGWNWHMDVLCEEVQIVLERVINGQDKAYDLVINVPPGTSKSTIVTRMAPVWAWTRMPHFRTIAVSHAQPLAYVHARKSRQIVESEKFQQMFPEVGELREDQNAKGNYENSKSGMRLSSGMRGVVGHHGHAVIIDDPLDPKATRSEAEMTAAKEWIGGTLSTRLVDKDKTPTIMIMQRLHVEDPSAWMLAGSTVDSPVRHICLPGELKEGVNVQPPYLRHRYIDGLLDPIRLSRKWLRSQLTDSKLGHFGYVAQILQAPEIAGSGMFDVNQIRFGRLPPASEFRTKVRYWDNAGTEKNPGGAQTSGAKLGQLRTKQWWIEDMIVGQWATHERERVKRSVAHADGTSVRIGVEQEPGSGGKDQAISTVGNLSGFDVKRDRPTGKKEVRADPFSVQVNEGNVWVPEGASWWPALRAQMAAFPQSKQRDMIDSLSGAFSLATKTIVVGRPIIPR